MIDGWRGAGKEPIDDLRYWCEQELAKGTGNGFIIGVLPGQWEDTHAAYYQVCMALWDAGIRNVPVTTIPLPADTCQVFWIRHDRIWDAYLILKDLPVWATAPTLPKPSRVACQLGDMAPVLCKHNGKDVF